MTEDEVFPVGSNALSSPNHQASLFGQYEFGSGSRKGFGVSAGLFYKGRALQQSRDYVLPSYTTLEAGLYYRGFENVELQFNVRNLTNALYAESVRTNTYGAKVGAPRNVTFRVVYRF